MLTTKADSIKVKRDLTSKGACKHEYAAHTLSEDRESKTLTKLSLKGICIPSVFFLLYW